MDLPVRAEIQSERIFFEFTRVASYVPKVDLKTNQSSYPVTVHPHSVAFLTFLRVQAGLMFPELPVRKAELLGREGNLQAPCSFPRFDKGPLSHSVVL